MSVEESHPSSSSNGNDHSTPPPTSNTPTLECIGRGPWPEDDPHHQCCMKSFIHKWSYSYMSPILSKGAEIHTATKQRQKELQEQQQQRERQPSSSQIDNNSRVESSDNDNNNNHSSTVTSPSLPLLQQLTQDDLYASPASMRVSYLRPKFNQFYAQTNRKLLSTLWHLASPSFHPAGLCQLITVIAQVAVPMFVWQLLRILESNPNKNVFAQAIPYVFFILLADIANAYGTHRQRFLAMKSGVTIRIAMIGAIYERVLRLTPLGRRGLTTGAVTNLFAIDTQKIYEVTAEGHLLWSAPLSMLLVAIALIVVVGPSMAVGIALLMLFVPVVQMISNRMMEIRKMRVNVTDQRVEIVNAMLQGIKVTKLNNYEGKYIERIKKVRDEELGLLRRELYVWSMVMAVQFISPVVASAGAFAAFSLTGNILTTADAFTALLLFNALRFPINYASRLVGKVAQARESARRISIFMQRETRGGAILGEEDEWNSNRDDQFTVNHKQQSSSRIPNFIKRKRPSGTSNREGAGNGHIKSSLSKPALDDSTKSALALDDSSRSVLYDLPFTNDPILVIKNGMFHTGNTVNAARSWEDLTCGADNNGFTVGGVNMSVRPGEILAIVGPVGSGKSTIINAIIGEISVSPKTIMETHGKVAYASQVAFILNATLRDNILFGNEFDVARYNQVLDACCLREDIEQLSNGDQTEIGERGVTLSGGQKQRVSLARVVYSNPDIALFDDPLSALDAGTARAVFDRLFKQCRNTLLSKTAVVLVTHASHFLNIVNQIMVVVDGSVPFCGTWGELSEAKVEDRKAEIAIESMLNAVQENGTNSASHSKFNHSYHQDMDVDDDDIFRKVMLHADNITEALMSLETREHGVTRSWAWTIWFQYAGGFFFTIGLFVLFIAEKAFYFGTEWWMTVWTEAADSPTQFMGMTFPPQTDGLSAQWEYLKVYLIMLIVGFICAFFRTIWIVSGGVRCSKKLYSMMTHCVLHSPMVYFETTPMGRLLNRFTYDAEILDVTLVWSMSMLLIASSWFLTALIVMVVILPWMCVILIPISICYVMIHLHYRKSGADLQRLDALSRSPLQTMLAEGIEGSATIRTFHKEPTFMQRFQGFADKSTAAQMNFLGAQRWLGVRIELLGAVIVFSASLLVIIFNEAFSLGAGLVALLIRWSAGFTISLSFLLDNAAEAEGAVTAIERIKQMSELTQEPNFEKMGGLDDSWPPRGELEFRNVQMRYRPRLPLSLDGLSFRVESGEHCGVVGRTGAGKSSLLTALFRLVEIESGTVSIDNTDLSKIGLSDIRGRPNGISIIPQDPFLFAGTLRECLDPFGASTDDNLLYALASVRMLPPEKGTEILDSRVEEGGTNYSVGERSLLVLARAMLARPNLLLMDEATANIDGETDSFIQRMLRTRFAGTTVLTIAHRLETIMDYDKILVMENGKAAEFGTPSELIGNNGIFKEL
ncbi:hypothetical protein ACHAXR_008799, partial [Thalassiosira sp. AJA248-18]